MAREPRTRASGGSRRATLTVSSPLVGWGVEVTPTVGAPFNLGPQQRRVVTAAYTIPLTANGQINLTTITATAQTSLATVGDEIHVSTTAWTISKVVTPTAFIRPGELLTYTLTLTNIGDLPSGGTYTITDPLPQYTSFVSANPAANSTDPVQWVRSTAVMTGGAVTLTYTVRVDSVLTDGLNIVNQNYTVSGGGAITAAGAPVSVEVEGARMAKVMAVVIKATQLRRKRRLALACFSIMAVAFLGKIGQDRRARRGLGRRLNMQALYSARYRPVNNFHDLFIARPYCWILLDR